MHFRGFSCAASMRIIVCKLRTTVFCGLLEFEVSKSSKVWFIGRVNPLGFQLFYSRRKTLCFYDPSFLHNKLTLG